MGIKNLFKVNNNVARKECCPLSCICGQKKMPQRIVVTILTFFMISSSYMNRVLFIFVVPLISGLVTGGRDLEDTACPPRKEALIESSGKIEIAIYPWDADEQTKLIGAYYYGYPCLMLASAFIVTSYGAKWVLAISMYMSSLCTLLTPTFLGMGGNGQTAYWGSFGIRVIQGAFEGILFCNINGIVSGWIPKTERGTLGYFILCAPHIGTFCGFFIAGKVIAKYGQWKGLFYAYGCYSILCTTLFVIFCHSTFTKHPYITEAEYNYLKENMPPMSTEKKRLPCCRVFKCIPFYVLLLTSMVYDFVFFSIQNELPKYMKTMLQFNTDELSVFTAVPYIGSLIVSICCGMGSDWLLKKNKISITNIRKIFVILGIAVPAVFALGATLVQCNQKAVIVMFILAVAAMGFYSAGWANYCDLSPGFAALLTAIANTITACQGFISSILVGAIVGKEPTFKRWICFMGLVFGYASIASIFYGIFGSGLRQQWDIDAVGAGKEKDRPEDVKAHAEEMQS